MPPATKGIVVFDEFDQFNASAREVVARTQDAARAFGHRYISTEHILLGLLRVEGSIANKALRSFGLTAELVRAQVLAYIGEGQGAPLGEIPYTSWAREVLWLASQEAARQDREQVGTEHILLCIFRETDGLALPILRDFDISEQEVEDAVSRQLNRTTRPSVGAASS